MVSLSVFVAGRTRRLARVVLSEAWRLRATDKVRSRSLLVGMNVSITLDWRISCPLLSLELTSLGPNHFPLIATTPDEVAPRIRCASRRKSRTDQHICASWSGLDLQSLNHSKPRQYRLAIGRTRDLMCLSKDTCVGEDYFFFFLPVFFFAFFAFLAMLPSVIPKLVQCKSTSTRINTEYTTIAKLIRRASKKVNGGHTVALYGRRSALMMCRRDT
jgi:hypothetical protein